MRASACREWIWIGIAYNFVFYVLMTQLGAVCLAAMQPPKRDAVIVPKEQILANLKCADFAMLRCRAACSDLCVIVTGKAMTYFALANSAMSKVAPVSE